METNYSPIIRLLTDQLKETRRAYQSGMPGVTYEDMKAAAVRLLEMRASIERATGRPVKSKATPAAIAALLRSDL